jgi:hypothetical protein
MTAARDEDVHDLDYSEIDELDEISGDEQLALIWCNTHETWEWHWIDRCDVS